MNIIVSITSALPLRSEVVPQYQATKEKSAQKVGGAFLMFNIQQSRATCHFSQLHI